MWPALLSTLKRRDFDYGIYLLIKVRSGVIEPDGLTSISIPTLQALPPLNVVTARKIAELGKARGCVTVVQARPSQWRIIGPDPLTPTAQTLLLEAAATPVK